MGKINVITLPGKSYNCKYCQTDLAFAEDIVSKNFQCRSGKAYLFDKVVNVNLGEKEQRIMITGIYSVSDIFCVCCGFNLGWKYETAYKTDQKYKEGKFILERFMIIKPDGSIEEKIAGLSLSDHMEALA